MLLDVDEQSHCGQYGLLIEEKTRQKPLKWILAQVTGVQLQLRRRSAVCLDRFRIFGMLSGPFLRPA